MTLPQGLHGSELGYACGLIYVEKRWGVATKNGLPNALVLKIVLESSIVHENKEILIRPHGK